jgi:hypothetical protein
MAKKEIELNKRQYGVKIPSSSSRRYRASFCHQSPRLRHFPDQRLEGRSRGYVLSQVLVSARTHPTYVTSNYGRRNVGGGNQYTRKKLTLTNRRPLRGMCRT